MNKEEEIKLPSQDYILGLMNRLYENQLPAPREMAYSVELWLSEEDRIAKQMAFDMKQWCISHDTEIVRSVKHYKILRNDDFYERAVAGRLFTSGKPLGKNDKQRRKRLTMDTVLKYHSVANFWKEFDHKSRGFQHKIDIFLDEEDELPKYLDKNYLNIPVLPEDIAVVASVKKLYKIISKLSGFGAAIDTFFEENLGYDGEHDIFTPHFVDTILNNIDEKNGVTKSKEKPLTGIEKYKLAYPEEVKEEPLPLPNHIPLEERIHKLRTDKTWGFLKSQEELSLSDINQENLVAKQEQEQYEIERFGKILK